MHGVEAQPVEAGTPRASRARCGCRSRAPAGSTEVDRGTPGRVEVLGEEAAARSAAGSCPPARNGCRPRRGAPSARGRARRRRAPSARPACRRPGRARSAARRRSPSCAGRRSRRPASARRAVMPELRQVGQPLDRGLERALGRERADVQLVDHGLVPGPAAPAGVPPAIAGGGRPPATGRARPRPGRAMPGRPPGSRRGARTVRLAGPRPVTSSNQPRSRRCRTWRSPRRGSSTMTVSAAGAHKRKRTVPSARSSAPNGIRCPLRWAARTLEGMLRSTVMGVIPAC